MRVLVALGGNALLRRGETPEADTQLAHVARAAPALAAVAAGHELVLVHGNGPQVGMLALQNGADATITRPYPLSDLVAETQGLIGYWLQQALANAGLMTPVVSLVTQTVVDPRDPAFDAPTKFVGLAYTAEQASALARTHGWTVAADGPVWRRVVASPTPLRVVETEIAAALLHFGVTVVLAGGGGAPVIEGREGLRGVDAVVDKDHVAALLAQALRADTLIMLTDVPAVMTGFDTPSQRPLGDVTTEMLADSTFAAGSMGPKVTAACRFVSATGGRAAIGSLDDATAVISGHAGTQVRASAERTVSCR